MVLYSTDTKLLCSMKHAQGTLSGYVLVTDSDVRYCPGCYMADVNRALDSPQNTRALKLSKAEVRASLDRMVELELLIHPASAPVYQVTYDGWNARQVHIREICKAVVTHVLFPSLVAFITTLLTLSMKGCTDQNPNPDPQVSSEKPAYYDDAEFSDSSIHD